jgi:hypothetical protein
MPRQSKGARLELKRAERGRSAVWIIRDGEHRESTGCGTGEFEQAEQALHDISPKNIKRHDSKKLTLPTSKLQM